MAKEIPTKAYSGHAIGVLQAILQIDRVPNLSDIRPSTESTARHIVTNVCPSLCVLDEYGFCIKFSCAYFEIWPNQPSQYGS